MPKNSEIIIRGTTYVQWEYQKDKKETQEIFEAIIITSKN